MLIDHLKRTVGSTGGTLIARSHAQHQTLAVLSRLRAVRAQAARAALARVPLWHRAHPTRPLLRVSGRLSASSRLSTLVCGSHVVPWEGAEARLRAAYERVLQRAKEGQYVPRSFGGARAGARLPGSLSQPKQEPAFLLSRGKLEAWKERSEPPGL
jgi:hypothetical protein